MDQLERLKASIAPEEAEDNILQLCLDIAKTAILNRRYPFGYTADTEIETRYEFLQVQAATAVFNKRGAEGQTAHSENGVARTYDVSDVPASLLKSIVPMVLTANSGSVSIGNGNASNSTNDSRITVLETAVAELREAIELLQLRITAVESIDAGLQESVELLQSHIQAVEEMAATARSIADLAAVKAATAGERAEEGIRRADANTAAIAALQAGAF